MIDVLFRCKYINKSDNNQGGVMINVGFEPLSSGNEEVFASNPSARVELAYLTEEAADQFEVAKDYKVSFEQIATVTSTTTQQ